MAQSPAFRGFAIFALCWIAPSLALFAYAQDLGDAGDGDLSTVSQRLPADRNALTTLAKAAQNLDYPDDYIEAADRIDLAIVGVAWDSDWVSDVLANNATALAHFERAIETRAFQIRVRSTYGEERALGDWLMLAKLRALETRVQGLRGDGEDALGAALALAQFGTRIRELDGGRMRHYLTGTSIIRIASTAMQRILKDVPIALPQAKEFVRSLEELRLHRDGWARVAIGEYQWRRGVLDEVVTARAGDGKRLSRDPFARDVLDSMVSLTPTAYSLQRNRTLRRLAGHYRTSVAQVPSACLELSQQKPEGGGLPPTPGAYSVGRNALGDYWADLARTSIRAHRITDCVSQSLLSAVQVMVALRA
ncbi:MAG: hypothetical protein GY733_10065, partial [bacterium]|nr:hypothetical protein [bacterium]